MNIQFSILAFVALSAASPAVPQGLDKETRVRVVESIGAELEANYVFPDVAAKCAKHLVSELAAGKYDSFTTNGSFANRLTEDLQTISKDLHMRVMHQPERAQVQREDPFRARQQRLEAMRKANYGFEKVEIMNGNVGYLDLRSFSDLGHGRKTAAAAMAYLANSDAIIFDLRRNGGGSPEMVQFLCSYLFSERTHLNSLYFRPSDTTQEYWTLDELPGERRPDVPVYVLTGSRTFSAAEEFSYNLLTQGRATLVGQTTGGGANPGGTVPVGDGYLMFVPTGRAINPITGTNWEGVGVQPDIVVPFDEALETALKDAREAARDYSQYKADERVERLSEVSDQLRIAEAYYAAGKLDQGARLVKVALGAGLEFNLYDGESIDFLGQQYMESEARDMGLAVLCFNADRHPDVSDVWGSLGEAYRVNDQNELALAAFKTCLKLEPTHAYALRQVVELQQD